MPEASPRTEDTQQPGREWRQGGGTFKETLTALVMAFGLAFIFRAFVLEAFLIPTGSMAPTLLGAHVRLHSEVTGRSWAASTRDPSLGDAEVPARRQGSPERPLIATDPMLGPPGYGVALEYVHLPRLAGDRIFVFKYLYSIFDPSRWDVVVFKYPVNPSENYIKRLIALPGEQVALVDGDVFVRPASLARPDEISWAGPGWEICRKPERVQRTLWQLVHTARFASRTPLREAPQPWISRDPDWLLGRTYVYSGDKPTKLMWNSARWPLTDALPFNETSPETASTAGGLSNFPVSDLRLDATVRLDGASDEPRIAAVIRARGHEFRAEVTDQGASVSMRSLADDGEWVEVDAADKSGILTRSKATPTHVEFWHVDQALWLFLDGKLVAGGPKRGAYDWSPGLRVHHAMGTDVASLSRQAANQFANPGRYWPAEAAWEISGGAVTLFDVAIYRDVHYRADIYPSLLQNGGEPALGTHPLRSPALGADDFFVCGDNTGSSSDSRLWASSHPWVFETFPDSRTGLVPRELLIGKAFFVYFPAPQPVGRLVIPDFGRMRFIR
ncbi:MAG: signal peptidase I [Phycisphaeraceae bacterium]|nr:signal peptidase I [Phycisphaeraceae bacterium]MCW5755201.1 signal peptidase I [Phycisphaeraceae bacterium]